MLAVLAAESRDGTCGAAERHATVSHAPGNDGQLTLINPLGESLPSMDGRAMPLFV